MTLHLPAALYALFLWWFLTGAIMFGAALPGATAPLLALAALLAGAGLALVAASAGQADPGGAVLAFTAAVLIWGAVEIAFLTGAVTGPRREPCPEGTRGWRRVRLAVLTILHHEVALLVALAGVAALTWNADNPTALQVFAALWAMRLSAKLNLFLGVPVTNSGMLPERLAYLASYFRSGPVNLLFPLSVTLGTVATAFVIQAAIGAGPGESVGLTLVATFLALAVLEHWFMVLPLPSAVLWRWSTPARRRPILSADLLTLAGPDQSSPLPRRRS